LTLESTPSTPVQPKVKSKNLDVPKLWAEAAPSQKPSAAFVVIGHVDHGKSTLMGRLLLDTGAVPQRDIDKYRKEATEKGKGSFALAWVMDTSSTLHNTFSQRTKQTLLSLMRQATEILYPT
jgi:elongation factor 1 alpha-like protein